VPGERSSPEEIAAALAPLRANPEAAAILSDLDGTLAPIVERAEDAELPPATAALLSELAERYAHVAIVSGRSCVDARRIVELDSISYVGNHGLEILEPGANRPSPAPALGDRAGDAMRFMSAGVDGAELSVAGVRVEDKGPIVALHWRAAEDEARAELAATSVAERAAAAGLAPHRGRKVIELRPAVAVDKGTAVSELLEGLAVRAALYGGDDRTDADAFAALTSMRDAGELDAAVTVAALAPESPAEVERDAELRVEGTGGFVAVLEALA
jgi:trehalose 6-phosphate phosphatase